MATRSKAPSTDTEHPASSTLAQTAEKGVRSLQAFVTKFNNDWVMSFAAGLAFNLITAILPILIAIISIVGFTIGRLDPTLKTDLINHLKHIFPSQISSGNFLKLALDSLSKNAGLLGMIAILLAIFGGSRLFVSLEGYFDIIFHTRPRGLIRQNIMAIGMLLVFVVLIPLMIFGSSIPALVQTVLEATPVSPLVANGFFDGLVARLAAVFISWVLFEAIYIVVPNQHIRFRNSWPGAVIAAVLLQAYLTLFPFYVTHFLGSYTGIAGFAVILLLFFYYFAVIILLGAEINAFFAERIRVTPDNLAVMVHKLTSHLPATEKDLQEQATPSHRPEGIPPNSETQSPPAHASNTPGQIQSAPPDQSKKRKSSPPGTSRTLALVEVAAGTALAFIVQLFQLRRKK